MIISNVQWHNSNEHRNYPLEDTASGLDDAGAILPDDILADLHLWLPDSVSGNRVFISSIGITSQVVSLTLARDDGSFSPLAGLTLVRPVIPYHNYPLQAFEDGLAGWAAFGSRVNTRDAQSWRFSTAANSMILSRAAQAYPAMGVTSLRVRGRSSGLERLVELISGSPDELVIERATRTIDSVSRECLVFRLNHEVAGEEIFQRFVGPCGGTPDSKTCDRPDILLINDVSPDCDGTITIDFVEQVDPELGALIYPRVELSRLYLDYLLGLSDICDRPTLTSLPNPGDVCTDPCDDYSDLGPYAGGSIG